MVCPAIACLAPDAGTSQSCSQVTTQTGMRRPQRTAHSVFLPGTTCRVLRCWLLHAIQSLRRRAAAPNLQRPGCVYGAAAHLRVAHSLSYTSVCYEGCVRPPNAPVLMGRPGCSGPMATHPPPAALAPRPAARISSALCCNSATDFPNPVRPGPAGVPPPTATRSSTCTCAAGCFMPGVGCVVSEHTHSGKCQQSKAPCLQRPSSRRPPVAQKTVEPLRRAGNVAK